MIAIVNVDKNWGIGFEGDLLVHISEDMKFFRKTTTNNVIVMGRKTFESLPNQKPLKNRTNIVITTDKNFKKDGVVVYNNIQDMLEGIKQFDKPIYVIGGGSIYKQLMPYCNKAYVTKTNVIREADTYFPNLDKDNTWEIISTSEKNYQDNVEYQFVTYEKVN